MAEPISIAASVLTLTEIFIKVGRRAVAFVVTLKDAPTELLLLANEVNDVSTILKEIQVHVPVISVEPQAKQGSVSRGRETLNQALSIQLRLVHNKVTELENLIESLRKTTGAQGNVTVDSIRWAMKKKQATKLLMQLQSSKKALCNLLDIGTA